MKESSRQDPEEGVCRRTPGLSFGEAPQRNQIYPQGQELGFECGQSKTLLQWEDFVVILMKRYEEYCSAGRRGELDQICENDRRYLYVQQAASSRFQGGGYEKML